MHIVLVSYEFPPVTATGGIGSYMHHLAITLSRANHKVTVFSANPGGDSVTVVQQEHCINYLVPANTNESFREQVVVAFGIFQKFNKADIIESPEVGACALLVKEKYPQIPLIVKMHSPGVLITKVNNTYIPLSRKLRFVAGAILRGNIDGGYWASHDKNRDSDVEYRICMIADVLLSPSAALKKWAISFWGIPAGRIRVLPNPFSVDDRLFSLPFQNRPQAIAFVGKLSVLKGMKAFTKAIPLILKKNKDCKIYLTGRDEVENGVSMKAWMQEQLPAYAANIFFTGVLSGKALKEIYASSKVCVFPSLWENYPTVVLEAMAAGAAVVAAEVGGIPEIVEHQTTGLLFNPKHPGQIAKAVNELLENDTRRLTIAAAARNALFHKMSNAAFEKDLLEVYKQFENAKLN